MLGIPGPQNQHTWAQKRQNQVETSPYSLPQHYSCLFLYLIWWALDYFWISLWVFHWWQEVYRASSLGQIAGLAEAEIATGFTRAFYTQAAQLREYHSPGERFVFALLQDELLFTYELRRIMTDIKLFNIPQNIYFNYRLCLEDRVQFQLIFCNSHGFYLPSLLFPFFLSKAPNLLTWWS